jgi:hypothetical protein
MNEFCNLLFDKKIKYTNVKDLKLLRIEWKNILLKHMIKSLIYYSYVYPMLHYDKFWGETNKWSYWLSTGIKSYGDIDSFSKNEITFINMNFDKIF